MFSNTDDLQTELDRWMESYNRDRTHQGKRCQGRTPIQIFTDGLDLARKAKLNYEEELTTEEKPAA